MPHYAVAAVGADRPGIVAAVTGVLVDHGCNLEDSSMSILGGHFTMMLVVSAPAGSGPTALERAIDAATGHLDLVVAVREISDDTRTSGPIGEPWTVSVYGADRPGIVHAVASELAAAGVNIVDLTTRVVGDEARPVYAMLLDVALPAGLDGEQLRSRLGAVARELGVECSVHPAEADLL